jgi:hypothetical protein
VSDLIISALTRKESNDNSSGIVKSIPTPSLSNKQIFVFGSNLKGVHGAGSALSARKQHGAILGQGIGLQGNSYAIPTKETPYKTLPLEKVESYVKEFLLFAKINDDLIFNVTRIGCGLAGFTPEQIAPLFKDSPKNVNLPDDFTSSHQSNDMLKLGIVGASRTTDDNLAYEQIKIYVQNLQKENPEIEIVSGGASGVDSLAIQIAKDLNIPYKVFEPKTPNWDGFKARNLEIAKYSTKVVSFANKFTTTKCYHCERVGKDNNHEKTAGCYTGYNHGEYETIVLI